MAVCAWTVGKGTFKTYRGNQAVQLCSCFLDRTQTRQEIKKIRYYLRGLKVFLHYALIPNDYIWISCDRWKMSLSLNFERYIGLRDDINPSEMLRSISYYEGCVIWILLYG